LSKTVINYLLATLAGILALVPGFFVITNLSQVQTTAAWTELKLPFDVYFKGGLFTSVVFSLI